MAECLVFVGESIVHAAEATGEAVVGEAIGDAGIAVAEGPGLGRDK